MINEIILNFYEYSSEYNKIQKMQEYDKLQFILLYPATIMNEKILNIFVGIITGLSMNIFTNTISFQNETFLELTIWVLRLFFTIVFCKCVIKFSITCTLIHEGVREKTGMPYVEKSRDYKEQLLKAFNHKYKKIKRETIGGITSAIALCILVIVFPVGQFIYHQWNL